MTVLVTGATGFVGRHLISALLAKGFKVRAVSRNIEAARAMPWSDEVEYVAADIHAPDLDVESLADGMDAIAHLAWAGLPNYQALFHFERNLPLDYAFLKRVIEAGVSQVLVTGTCFEYGLQSGPLSEAMAAQPCTPYGLAKHTLRLFLEALQRERAFTLQWVRLFYLHGEGQNPNSLLASLDRAIDAGDTQFNMSKGDQLRDYLDIRQAASRLASLIARRDVDGVINCCSGQPVSVRALVEQRVRERQSSIVLNLGHYGYSVHEPMAFWGVAQRISQLTGEEHAA
ncbi:NAD(P)-dependent oxidoreductase [Pseudomonas frederiksbergensis]|uniref:NAD-dependent epimerase/dehydratase family protein n=1 Tax=Pseudomonas frederiksbergensis TaxID=104087 RepID=UPI0019801904|nr:NAD(P)-dependent oxidoreductase [Pseudomonas frederiksbergensis]MBN3861292.1 NAD(P)-dependent oxidoreductase [Pseudomonas frederiksbergensis]